MITEAIDKECGGGARSANVGVISGKYSLANVLVCLEVASHFSSSEKSSFPIERCQEILCVVGVAVYNGFQSNTQLVWAEL